MTTQIRDLAHYKELYNQSVENPEAFWDKEAASFTWFKKYDKVCEWNFKNPDVKWFINGKLNITYNCLDRHLEERAVAFFSFSRLRIRKQSHYQQHLLTIKILTTLI